MEISEKTTEVIISFLEGTLSQPQADELIAWLDKDKQNAEYLRQIEEIWLLAKKTGKAEPDISEGLEKVREKITERDIRRLPRKEFRVGIPAIISVAATVLILIALSVTILVINPGRSKNLIITSAKIETVAPKGSRSFITLPDSTTIWLNSDTKLSYHTDYNATNRTIYLTGEAYFKVSRNDTLPFQVITSELKVTALGTAFNVKAYDDDSTIETTLEEGKVEIDYVNPRLNKKSAEPVLLRPNQTAEYKKQGGEFILTTTKEQKKQNSITKADIGRKPDVLPVRVSEVSDTKLYTSWKDNRWVFKNEQFSSLVPKLERRYNVDILLVDKVLEDYTFTGSLLEESLEQVLGAIQMTSPIRYEINSQEVRLYLDKQLERRYRKLTQ
ncbi:MAG: FecR domain-containing protein [Bacteroidota bacterium]